MIKQIIAATALLGTILLAVNGQNQAHQQELMVKTDEELIGTHFYLERNDEEAVDINLYLRNDDMKHPLIINLHGGAFIAGDADTLDTQSNRISEQWNVNVASVNYKLARGNYDIAYGTKEVVDTIRYFIDHADEYKIDPEKIFVLGYSAGAYHAMASVLELKQEGIDVAGQIICYGFIKDANDIYRSMSDEQKKTLAPALFILADNDPISDGSLTYQQSLAEYGVETAIEKYAEAIHGFIEENNPEYEALKTTSKSPVQEQLARKAEEQIGVWIQEQCQLVSSRSLSGQAGSA